MSLRENELKIQEYLDGTLLEPEKRALETHFQNCPECQTALNQANLGGTLLKEVRFPEGPDMQKRILEAIRKKASLQPQTTSKPWVPWAIGFAFGFAVILGILIGQGSFFSSLGNKSQLIAPTEPSFASAPMHLPKCPEPPILLAKATGNYSSPIKNTSLLFDGPNEFQTGENGRLDFLIRSETRVSVLPESKVSISEQQITLDRGEIWCEIAHQSLGRSFEVFSEGRTIRVIGTTFGVRKFDHTLEVSLFEGTLQVSPASGSNQILHTFEKALIFKERLEILPIGSSSVKIWASHLSPELHKKTEQFISSKPEQPSTSSDTIRETASETRFASDSGVLYDMDDLGKILQNHPPGN